jgi:hypothetical protein
MKKLYSLYIRGKRKEWEFDVWVDPKYLDEWRDDGIKIDEVVNIIPAWWVGLGFSVTVWCFFQDLLNFKNPFSK